MSSYEQDVTVDNLAHDMVLKKLKKKRFNQFTYTQKLFQFTPPFLTWINIR